ncbi:hypothetical protein I302_104667 [Kwoniella bestiolae CBS 10118]|uniref:VASt domain-containing protein n=1 Tax=Kwoniella bestiolae CBS 10118 TaxID=1296100 RepID=A0A1B9FS42_9TREE|nr:hypothetical protein I302_09264 [Kwoniella bestiolae CBS 10118]OCF21585.1 hypothetical protein I302_09264 [Kwoniella bestiolae CBS 10118]
MSSRIEEDSNTNASTTSVNTNLSPDAAQKQPGRSRGPSVGSIASTTSKPSLRSAISSSSISTISTVSKKASDSNLAQRQTEFEKKFTKRMDLEPLLSFQDPSSPSDPLTLPDDYMTILATQAADLQSSILIHGRLCLTRYHLCFRSNIIGIITMKVHALSDVVSIRKGTTAKWIQNAVYVRVMEVDDEGNQVEQHYGYGSLWNRDSLYDALMDCWKERAPERYEEFKKTEATENGEEVEEEEEEVIENQENTADQLKRTTGSGEQYKELALNVKIPLQLEQAYNLLYHNESFTTNFYTNEKKLTDLKISEWEEDAETGERSRTLNYVMHMNNTLGPKSSNCNGSETIVIADPETSYEIVSETQTPDIPSGKCFIIRTRTCLTHDILHHKQATRIHCTTQVDWSSSSLLKGTITPAVIKGQKEHHQQLVQAITEWVKGHPDDFGVSREHVEIKHETEIEHTTEEVKEKIGKTIIEHAGEIPDNPVMLVITVLFVVLLLLYIKG